ncbi:MAG: hypothetical protein Q8L29_01635, partial [archaeon]|nr:hypothetical protein [archaeon]
AEDYSSVNSAIFKLFNSSNYLINETISANPSIYLNILNLTEGKYFYNVSVNDTNGNVNNGETRNVTVDLTAPIIVMAATSTGQTTLSIGFTITETGSGGDDCWITYESGGSTNANSNRLTGFTVSNLGCALSYTYNVTCKDKAGNSNSTSSSFTTSACSSSGGDDGDSSGGGDDGGGDDESPIFSTYVTTADQFIKGYIRELGELDRMSFKIGTETHYLRAEKITSSLVTINVSSKPQQAIFRIGDTNKFDANGDGYYDLSAKLVGIKGAKANITIISILEKVPAVIESPVNNVNVGTANEEQNVSDQNSSFLSTISGFSTKVFDKLKVPGFLKSIWFWIGLLAAAGIIYGAIYFVREDDGWERKVKITEDSKDIKVG